MYFCYNIKNLVYMAILETPPDYELESTCKYCGEACNKDFCSKECVKNYLDD